MVEVTNPEPPEAPLVMLVLPPEHASSPETLEKQATMSRLRWRNIDNVKLEKSTYSYGFEDPRDRP
jgi:hypothetical protein